jgi:DNA-3-methyladenine glycosylase
MRFAAYANDPVTVARDLLGQRLVRLLDGERLAGIIVETEAYLGVSDRAAHTFNGRRTARNESMFLGAGHAYVYFTYGMHHCMNVVCGRKEEPVAVLIRAIEPTEGLDTMFSHRGKARRTTDLCSGPAKLTQALGIDLGFDGHDLRSSDTLYIERLRRRNDASRRVVASPRVGVAYAGSWARRLLRYHFDGNQYVSRR